MAIYSHENLMTYFWDNLWSISYNFELEKSDERFGLSNRDFLHKIVLDINQKV